MASQFWREKLSFGSIFEGTREAMNLAVDRAPTVKTELNTRIDVGGDVPPADGAATLTAFTAAAIARIVPLLPKQPRSWIVAGGGVRNLTLMRMLRERVAPATVEAADALGWSADAIEAQAFGFLAARGLKGLPLSYPATTGVPMPMTGGVIVRP